VTASGYEVEVSSRYGRRDERGKVVVIAPIEDDGEEGNESSVATQTAENSTAAGVLAKRDTELTRRAGVGGTGESFGHARSTLPLDEFGETSTVLYDDCEPTKRKGKKKKRYNQLRYGSKFTFFFQLTISFSVFSFVRTKKKKKEKKKRITHENHFNCPGQVSLVQVRGVPRVNFGRGGVTKMRPPPPSSKGEKK
jgi:hypothetical protein